MPDRAPGGPRRSSPTPRGARFEARTHRGAHGALACELFVPSRGLAGSPLLVMLHGCTQDADDFALGTRMNEHAERAGVAVLYPTQSRRANPNGCWSWFEPAHQGRRGEPALIAGAMGEVVAEGADGGRVGVAGLSAGGAMAALMGEAYPEAFALVAIHSGLPAGAAASLPEALGAMRSGARGRPIRPRALVVHGAAHAAVAPANALAIARAGRAAGPPPTARVVAGGRSCTRTRWAATPEAGPLELWAVEGLGHAWSGGSRKGSHADPAGPDASAMILRALLEPPG